MSLDTEISRRFADLAAQGDAMRSQDVGYDSDVYPPREWQAWSSSALHLIVSVFGDASAHAKNFTKAYAQCTGFEDQIGALKGIFDSARADYDGGYAASLQAKISGEIFGDFVFLAKAALEQEAKDVAAVLACAALEDALKRLAERKGLDIADKDMQQVVNALKASGAVAGAQKTLLDAMPKIRDYAMHANWNKITPQDVGSVIGFVEQLLLREFS